MRDGGWVKVAVSMMNLRVDGQYLEALVRNGGLGFGLFKGSQIKGHGMPKTWVV